jgi:hypothetical protein
MLLLIDFSAEVPSARGRSRKSVSTGPTTLDAMTQMTSVSRPTRRSESPSCVKFVQPTQLRVNERSFFWATYTPLASTN